MRKSIIRWLRSSKGSSSRITGRTTPRKSMRSMWKVPTVLSSLETSSKSFTSVSMRWPAEWMPSNMPASLGCVRPRNMPSSAKPRMDCSGVRSSWLMLATNSDLARDASSAASRASRVARSASRNSLTSIRMVSTPVTWPCSSAMAALSRRVSRRDPSPWRTCVSTSVRPPQRSNCLLADWCTLTSSGGRHSATALPSTMTRSRPLYSSQAWGRLRSTKKHKSR